MVAGATFVCDDVLAVEDVVSDMVAHPGPALMNMRDASAERLNADAHAQLGPSLGCDEAGWRLLGRRKAPALPLRAIYVLRRMADREDIRLSRLSPSNPGLLLGAGFATAIQSPMRLLRRLDLCAKLAARTAVFAIEAPAQAPPKAVAEAVLLQAEQNVP